MRVDSAGAFKYEAYPQSTEPRRKWLMRPARRIWLALLIASVGAMLWLKNDDVVVWLLADGIVGEGATRTLPDVLDWTGVVVFVASFFLMLGMGPIRVVAEAVSRALGPPVRRVLETIAVALQGVVKIVVLVSDRLRTGAAVVIRRTVWFLQLAWSISVATVTVLATIVAAIGSAIGRPLGLAGRRGWHVFVSTVRTIWPVPRGILIVTADVLMIIVWITAVAAGRAARYTRSGLSQARDVVQTGVTGAWAGVTKSARLLIGVAAGGAGIVLTGAAFSVYVIGVGVQFAWSMAAAAAGLVWKGSTSAARPAWGVVTAGAGFLQTGVTVTARNVGARVRFTWLKATAVGGRAWTVGTHVALRAGWIVVFTLRVLVMTTASALVVVWIGAAKTGRFVEGFMATGGGYLKVAGISAANSIRWAAIFAALKLAAVAIHIWAVVAIVANGIGLVTRFAWMMGMAAVGLVWAVISAVARFVAVIAMDGITLVLAGVVFVANKVGAVVRYAWVRFATTVGFIRAGITIASILVGGAVAIGATFLWRAISSAAYRVGAVVRYAWTRFTAVVGYVWAIVTTVAGVLRRSVNASATYLWKGVGFVAHKAGAVVGYVWVRSTAVVGHVWTTITIVSSVLGNVAVAGSGYLLVLVVIAIGAIVQTVRRGGRPGAIVFRYQWAAVSGIGRVAGIYTNRVASAVMSSLRGGAMSVAPSVLFVARSVHVVLRWTGLAGSAGLGHAATATSISARYAGRGLRSTSRHMVSGTLTATFATGWVVGQGAKQVWLGTGAISAGFVYVARTFWVGTAAVPDVSRFALLAVRRQPNRKGVSAMSETRLNRQRLQSLIITMVVFVLIGAGVVRLIKPPPPEPTVEVVHWANGHLTREGLLVEMAEEFNEANIRDENGTKIVVRVFHPPSELQAEWLIQRINYGTRLDLHKETNGYVDKDILDPTIVTPSSAHWLVKVNYQVGAYAVDIDGAESIVRPVIGIVTYEDMARCLGWPEKEIGFADIIALREDPAGWTKYPCADPEWGTTPLLAFTDPTTSSTGRSLHLALYLIAAGKTGDPSSLTVEDVYGPEVVEYVKTFQGLIDRYQIGTTALNTKIYQGPRYGQFFIMPEDNLIHLYEGTEKSFLNGVKTTAPPIDERMVMIYPSEGAMPRNNCACIVQPEFADWVSEEQAAAAEKWIEFIRGDEQQRAFMAAGFRPGTDIALDDPASKITSEFGLDPNQPERIVEPSLINSVVAAAIDDSWEQVKRPGIVTFVVDTSGSMLGGKIDQARDGMYEAMRVIAQNNRVGFVTFSDKVNTIIPVAPLAENRYEIANAIEGMRARGETALNDAIKVAIEMTDAAEGPEDAIRGIVVLTDGRANRCQTRLDEIIEMESTNERAIREFSGCGNSSPVQVGGGQVDRQSVIGTKLILDTSNPIQIFYIGIGEDADLDVGRMLAGATDGAFQAGTEENLAQLLAEFAKWL